MIYLDHAATTFPCQAAKEAFNNALEYANPSSLHSAGRQARELLEQSRAVIAASLNAEPEEIIFTSGGTEANALALNVRGEKLATTLEHSSVRENADKLVSPDKLLSSIQTDTKIVSCIYVCNEMGAVHPIAEIARGLKVRGVLFHTDAVQAFGKLNCDVKALGVDLMSLSAHKIGGIRGVGALYVRKGVNLKPLWRGGGQENGLRSGTEALPLIAAFAAAAQKHPPPAGGTLFTKEGKSYRVLLDYTVELFPTIIPDVKFVPPYDAPHILMFVLPGCPGQVVVRMLSDMGICVSTGSACRRGKTSPVLKSLSIRHADNVIRISFGEGNTRGDVEELAKALLTVKERFAM